MTCWKCQRETESGEVECATCSGIYEGAIFPPDDPAYDYEIDWSLPATVEDFRQIMATLPNFKIVVKSGTPEFKLLRRWLRAKS